MQDSLDHDLQTRLSALSSTLIDLSHRIHANPELAFNELMASKWTSDILEKAQFTLRRNVAGMETAFIASKGSGDLHVVICAEFDALPEIGHACGHNIIASAAIGAALLLAPLLDDLKVRLSVFGTPAEEAGGGKILMLDAGLFEDVDLAMMVHPAPGELDRMPCVAAQHLEVEFLGKAAHAAAFPDLGINALDAMTISQVAIGLLRQSMHNGEMVHGIITHGGDAPNIIPARTSARYIARANTLGELINFIPRIKACFEGGSVATKASLNFIEKYSPYSEFITDETLASIYRAESLKIQRPVDTDSGNNLLKASTDMANVSMSIPSIHPMLGIESLPAVNHQPEFTRACILPPADKAVLDAAINMARVTVKVAQTPDIRKEFANGAKRRLLRAQVEKQYPTK